MPLLKSLICFKGFDNGRRFLVISFLSYLFLAVLSPALAKAGILLVLILAALSPVLFAASIRRIRDAGFSLALAGIPVTVFWLSCFILSFIQHPAKYFIYLLVLLVTLGFTMLSHAKAKRKRNYVMGYDGPINLLSDNGEDNSVVLHQRIEPVIDLKQEEKSSEELFDSLSEQPQSAVEFSEFQGESDAHHLKVQQSESLPSDNMSAEKRVIQSELMLETEQRHSHLPKGSSSSLSNFIKPLLVDKTLRYQVLGGSAFVVLIFMVWILIPDSETSEEKINQQQASEPVKTRLNKIAMPDNYWIMLDENEALTIAWQGNVAEDQKIWSALTAQGDQSCADVSFENGEIYRPLKVIIKNGGDYYADFSPLDTKKLVQAIAFRSRFKLCGYEFSLKGTQALLMVNKKYSTYLENI